MNSRINSSKDSGRRNLAHKLDWAIKEVKKLQAEKQNLLKELYNDSLTGIANRRAFDEKLPELVQIAHSSKEPLALMLADVDGLKRVNDKLGHQLGDALLAAVGNSLNQAARGTDLAGRLGGDEYYAILPGFAATNEQSEDQLMRSTTARYAKAFDSAVEKLQLPGRLKVGVSFGIAILAPSESAESLYKRADDIARSNKRALYYRLNQVGPVSEAEHLSA